MIIRGLTSILIAASLTGAAFAQGAPSWSRADSPDDTFSVETPCSAAELDESRSMPAQLLPGLRMEPEQRVLCVKEQTIFAAAMITEPGLAQGDVKLFDYLRDETLAVETRKGTARSGEVSGQRAFYNRDASGTNIAETGFVEVNKTTVLFFIGGGEAANAADMNAAIDRFGQSLRLAGQ